MVYLGILSQLSQLVKQLYELQLDEPMWRPSCSHFTHWAPRFDGEPPETRAGRAGVSAIGVTSGGQRARERYAATGRGTTHEPMRNAHVNPSLIRRHHNDYGAHLYVVDSIRSSKRTVPFCNAEIVPDCFSRARPSQDPAAAIGKRKFWTGWS